MFRICGRSSNPNLVRASAALFFLVLFSSARGWAQSEPLGDVARENQQKKAADSPATPKVITNADLPKNPDGYTGPPVEEEQASAAHAEDAASRRAAAQRAAAHRAADQWKRTILAQKNVVANQQARVDELRAQIRFVDPNVAYDYYSALAYNQSQARLMSRLHQMEQQLDQQKRKLEEMQEAARRLGMHTPVYDP
jgi:hypothetical protein